jgi:CRP-like cAMP-binding protein
MDQYAKFTRVLKRPPGERTLAECKVLDDGWAQTVPLLGYLAEDARVSFCQHVLAHEYLPGATVASQGARAERLYVVYSGKLALMSRRGGRQPGSPAAVCVGGLGAHGTFGEIELLTKNPLEASAVAHQPTIIFSVTSEVFDRTLRPTYGRELQQRAAFLQKEVAPFRSWQAAALVNVAKQTRAKTVARGQVILDAATQAGERQVFFVVSGMVRMVDGGREVEGQPGLVGKGGFFGMQNVFSVNEATSFSARSSVVSLLTINAKEFATALDAQTLQYFGSLSGFAAANRQRRETRQPTQPSESVVETTQVAAGLHEAEPADGTDLEEEVDRSTTEGRSDTPKRPGGWLPLAVRDSPRPSRCWRQTSATRGVASHMSELVRLFDTNELLIAQLSAPSCVAILCGLTYVNRLLDKAGWWQGHASAQATRAHVENGAELSALSGLDESDPRVSRLQLEVLVKLTTKRLDLPMKGGGRDNAGMSTDVLDDIHRKIDDCLSSVHTELFGSALWVGDSAVTTDLRTGIAQARRDNLQ